MVAMLQLDWRMQKYKLGDVCVCVCVCVCMPSVAFDSL